MEMGFYIGFFIGALVMGSIVGLIPLIAGIVKKKKGLAIAGFITCIICNFIAGVFLSVPAAIVFLLIILLVKPKEKNNAPIYGQPGYVPPVNNAPYQAPVNSAPYQAPVNNAPYQAPVNSAPYQAPVNQGDNNL